MSELAEHAREFARLLGMAERHKQRMAAQGRRDEIDGAIAAHQELMAEFEACFQLRRTPDFYGALQRAAKQAGD